PILGRLRPLHSPRTPRPDVLHADALHRRGVRGPLGAPGPGHRRSSGVDAGVPRPVTDRETNVMRHLDLFAGIGGFSRAVEWLGGTTVGFVEWDAWNRRVLAKHWPEARFYGDITTVTDDDFRSLGRIDLITGGYPCQPFSLAGKRRGAEDDRHLWPEMRRVIDT